MLWGRPRFGDGDCYNCSKVMLRWCLWVTLLDEGRAVRWRRSRRRATSEDEILDGAPQGTRTNGLSRRDRLPGGSHHGRRWPLAESHTLVQPWLRVRLHRWRCCFSCVARRPSSGRQAKLNLGACGSMEPVIRSGIMPQTRQLWSMDRTGPRFARVEPWYLPRSI